MLEQEQKDYKNIFSITDWVVTACEVYWNSLRVHLCSRAVKLNTNI